MNALKFSVVPVVFALTACGGGGGSMSNVRPDLTISEFQEIASFGATADIVSFDSTQPSGNYRSIVITDDPNAFSNGEKYSQFDPENLTITNTTQNMNGLDIQGHADFEGQRYLVRAFVYTDEMAQIIFAERVPAGTTWNSLASRTVSSVSYPVMPSNLQNGFPEDAVLAITSEALVGSLPSVGTGYYVGRMIVRYDDTLDITSLGVSVDFGNETLSFAVDGNNDSYTMTANGIPINMTTGAFSSNNVSAVLHEGTPDARGITATINGEFTAQNGSGMHAVITENGANSSFMSGFVAERVE